MGPTGSARPPNAKESPAVPVSLPSVALSAVCRQAGRALMTTAISTGLLAGALAPAQAAPVAAVSTTVATTPEVTEDRFTRSLPAGWGAAPVGGRWLAGTTGTHWVASSAGRHQVAPGQGAVSSLPSVRSTATDVRVEVALSRAAGAGAGASASVLGRVVTGVGDYRARLAVTSSGALELHAARKNTLLNKVALSDLVYTAGVRMSVRVEVTGVAPTTVRAKAWRTGTAEPAGWQVTATDSTATLQQPGRVAVRTYTSGSATTPMRAAYHTVQVSAQPATTAPAPTAPAPTAPAPAPAAAGVAEFSAGAVGEAINAHRAAHGLPPLSVSRSGTLYAHAAAMARAGSIWHGGSDKIVGYVRPASVSSLVRAWAGSPAHNAWMLRAGVTSMQIGAAQLDGRLYGAVDFR